jgi:hypothetical protein
MTTTVLPNGGQWAGTHPESTALSNSLRCFGLDFSDAFLFGLGRGLNFLYWQSRKMPAPLVRGRIKPDGIVKNVTELLGARCEVIELPTLELTRSLVRRELASGYPVMIRLGFPDSSLLAGALESDYVVIVGVEHHDYVAMAQAAESEPTLVPLSSEFARWSERGVPQAVVVRLEHVPAHLAHILRASMRRHAAEILEPPVPYLGVHGIERFAQDIIRWPDRLRDVSMAASVFVQSWTHRYAGGDGYRSLYRRFLVEAFDILPCKIIEESVRTMGRAAVYWKGVVASLREVASGANGVDAFLREASRLLREAARLERGAMEAISEL